MTHGNAFNQRDEELAALAREIKQAQDEVRQVAPFTARVDDFDMAAAYAVSHRVHRERVREGAIPVGRKIGFTNPEMWARYGVQEPVWAYVYDRTVVNVSGQAAACSLGRFTEPKIEPEIIFHFRSTPPPGSGPEEILMSIDWVAHGFEIVQSHFPGWRFGAPDTVADAALHGMLLVGEPRPTDSLGKDVGARLEKFGVSLLCDGELRERGVGSNVLGSPLLAIAHLIALLQKLRLYEPLAPGELVTTGTITTAHPVNAGEVWSAEIDGIDLPGLSVTFTT